MSQSYEKMCEFGSELYSPIEVETTNSLYFVAQNGDILSIKDGALKTEFHFGGQPSALAVDSEGKNFYFADLAHQAILVRAVDDKNDVISELVKEYEG